MHLSWYLLSLPFWLDPFSSYFFLWIYCFATFLVLCCFFVFYSTSFPDASSFPIQLRFLRFFNFTAFPVTSSFYFATFLAVSFSATHISGLTTFPCGISRAYCWHSMHIFIVKLRTDWFHVFKVSFVQWVLIEVSLFGPWPTASLYSR